jgi:hypothetical protein
VLATVFSTTKHDPARDQIDAIAQDAGWQIPAWYTELKTTTVPILGSAAAMAAAAREASLTRVSTQQRPVDVGVTQPEQLVRYRFGQAPFASWLESIGPVRAERLARQAAQAIRPIMRPYRPMVVFLAAQVP